MREKNPIHLRKWILTLRLVSFAEQLVSGATHHTSNMIQWYHLLSHTLPRLKQREHLIGGNQGKGCFNSVINNSFTEIGVEGWNASGQWDSFICIKELCDVHSNSSCNELRQIGSRRQVFLVSSYDVISLSSITQIPHIILWALKEWLRKRNYIALYFWGLVPIIIM